MPGGASGKEPPHNARKHSRRRFDPWEDPREEEIATHSSPPVWRTPWTQEPTMSRVTESDTTEAT